LRLNVWESMLTNSDREGKVVIREAERKVSAMGYRI